MTSNKPLINQGWLTNLLLMVLMAMLTIALIANQRLTTRHDKCLEVYLSAQVGGQPALVKQIICENLKEKTNV